MIAITRGGQYHPETAAVYLAKGEIPYGLFNPVTPAEKLKPRLCSVCHVYFPSAGKIKLDLT